MVAGAVLLGFVALVAWWAMSFSGLYHCWRCYLRLPISDMVEPRASV